MTPLVLTAEPAPADFAEQEGQPTYMISQASIPEFEADDGSTVPGYEGLIAYSESEEHGVLQLED
ncbi:hypothetical protein ACR71O_25135 [Klebsiella pneumoniae]|uniref:hypothetical protein n=1 Tax=Klebsiella pneumoniae TaxID=573 RepID=UPI001144F2DC|nr:hypothetical protein [Klebsiella pneumoniae]HDS2495002.1 hypothetical protein [Klebsiella pneumoniae subsp. pneumoniae]TYX80585.1 hypothetical protein FCG84_012690 [Klebsiella pneumoniae]CAF2239191.1 hypothetical protein AI2803V1_2536 [Klebsiella pneumoniae]CAH5008269.1 hypothetical protein AI2803V1_2536 [Klebsiella pneumoniae]VAU53185.1 Uncharacterised protein [Klebsiella pneumoniae]